LARENSKGTELELFKGRKADLTHAILHILSKEALVKYDVHKKIIDQGFKNTHYGTIKKRKKSLQEAGYLTEVGMRKTQPGNEGILYETTFKALSAMEVNVTDLDDFFRKLDEIGGLELLALLKRIKAK
jgi:DNA-binding PadR family transcriptional regulator